MAWTKLDLPKRNLYSEGESVVIVGDHPHRGCSGRVGRCDPNSAPVARGMLLIDLDNCQHLTDGCYARPHNLRRLP